MCIYIGFITYGESTAKYLPYFLPSLKAQAYKDCKILAIDNSETEDNENSAYIKNNFPEIDLKRPGENLGFAKAFNLMIAQAINEGAEYFLALNPDMILEPDLIEELVKAMSADEKIAAVQPKILKWDFIDNRKTNQIDSLGLALNKEHRFFDAHQGETVQPDLIVKKEIFGFTGAAVLLRLKALEDVAFTPLERKPSCPVREKFSNGVKKSEVYNLVAVGGLKPPTSDTFLTGFTGGNHQEYFDELMFMYKEDCDLSYRLRLAGWKIVLETRAIAYHNRQAAAQGKSNLVIALNRSAKSKAVKQWSFLNQWILLLKLKNLPFSWRVKLATVWYQFKSLIYILLFEQYLFKELFELFKLSGKISDRRRQLKIRVKIKEIEKFMYENQ